MEGKEKKEGGRERIDQKRGERDARKLSEEGKERGGCREGQGGI